MVQSICNIYNGDRFLLFVFFKIDKTYKALEEEIHRFEIFKENVQKIEEHNKMYHLGKKSYYMGVNQFSDLVRETSLNFHKLQDNFFNFWEVQTYLPIQTPF